MSPASTAEPILEGRRFRDVTEQPAGDVGGDTVFDYHQEADDTIWGRYAGGAVRLGYLVGTRRGAELDFRYVHVTEPGETAAGHCTSRIEVLPDGRLRLHETWQWESQAGTGSNVVEELPPGI